MKPGVELCWKSWASKTFFITFMAISIILYVTQYLEWGSAQIRHIPYPSAVKISGEEVPSVHPEYAIYTSGCRIPALNPFDSKVRKYINTPRRIDCQAGRLELTTADQSNVIANITLIESQKYNCCYNALYRVEDKPDKYSGSADNKFRHNSTCWPIVNETVPIHDEFIRVTCYDQSRSKVYTNLHAFVPWKKHVEGRCLEIANKEISPSSDSGSVRRKPSVMILGLDALSRINLQRQMPRTYEYLISRMGAVELLGYNKVADNTFPNLVPVTSGYFESELQFCWKKKSEKFDSCPWIWKTYSEKGYRTIFGEDAPWMGIWTYLRTGFVQQPTDYYLRPYMLASEKEIGWKKDLNSNLCQGPRLTLQVMLDYARQVATNFANSLYFSLLWTVSLSHDYLNYPKVGDDYWLDFFAEMDYNNVFNNTVLIVMSDHGLRFGSIRETYQGKLEERLPFLLAVFPEWFQEAYPKAVENFRRNRHYLTTPFDLHSMLEDLTNLDSVEDQALASRAVVLNNAITAGKPPRAISLFLPIYEGRTCSEAAIEDHWCTCVPSIPVDSTSTFAVAAAERIMRNLTESLKNYTQCAPLSLQSIDSVRAQNRTGHLNGKDTREIDYSVMLTTLPGGAKFEATMRYVEEKAGQPTSDRFVITGSVSRINVYGDQSWCVDDYKMKKYCFCAVRRPLGRV